MSAIEGKAKRATVEIGPLSADGYPMPNGEYRMSLSSAAKAVGLTPRNAFDFLRSKAAKHLLGEGYTDSVFEVELEPSPDQARGQSRIQAISLTVVSKYWLWQAYRGNKQAFALVDALLQESLERRFDAAFGVEQSESERVRARSHPNPAHTAARARTGNSNRSLSRTRHPAGTRYPTRAAA